MVTGFRSAMIMLVIQFLLGMAVNLFVTIPTDHPGARPAEYFSGVVQSVTWAILHGHALLILHASLGLLLVISAFGLLVQAIQTRLRAMTVAHELRRVWRPRSGIQRRELLELQPGLQLDVDRELLRRRRDRLHNRALHHRPAGEGLIPAPARISAAGLTMACAAFSPLAAR